MGAPTGNKNASYKNRRWTQAIDKALKRFESVEHKIAPGEALDRIAERLIKMAATGDREDFKVGLREIGDRLEGKAPQALEIAGGLGLAEMTGEQLLGLFHELNTTTDSGEDSQESGSESGANADDSPGTN